VSIEIPPFELDQILPILPHRAPFLFVDRVCGIEPGKSIVAQRRLRPDEPQFAGHFPGKPMMPGVLVTEALAQACGLLVGLTDKLTQPTQTSGPRNFLLAEAHLKFIRPALPGDVLELRASIEMRFGGLYRFQVEATVREELIARGTLTLAPA
jgi:3-hydroxyacyl-[acyl-carrier-protein] dehydratase